MLKVELLLRDGIQLNYLLLTIDVVVWVVSTEILRWLFFFTNLEEFHVNSSYFINGRDNFIKQNSFSIQLLPFIEMTITSGKTRNLLEGETFSNPF